MDYRELKSLDLRTVRVIHQHQGEKGIRDDAWPRKGHRQILSTQGSREQSDGGNLRALKGP